MSHRGIVADPMVRSEPRRDSLRSRTSAHSDTERCSIDITATTSTDAALRWGERAGSAWTSFGNDTPSWFKASTDTMHVTSAKAILTALVERRVVERYTGSKVSILKFDPKQIHLQGEGKGGGRREDALPHAEAGSSSGSTASRASPPYFPISGTTFFG